MKNTKLKKKGQKLYRNAHGTVYRVKPNYKLTQLNQRRRIQRKLKAEITA